MLDRIGAHDGQSREQGVYVRGPEALHVDLGEIGVEIARQVVVVAQVVFGVGRRERGQHARVHVQASVSVTFAMGAY